MIEFKIPDIGENITKGTIVSIFVKIGDSVKKGQDLLEFETDKASLPIPSPCDGVIKEILVTAGTEIKVGAIAFRIEEGAGTKSGSSAKPSEPAVTKKESVQPQPQKYTQAQPQTLATPHASEKVDLTTTKDTYVVVIGAGPGGYAAAFLASDLGLKVALVDLDVNPGGVCLYRGCIPSKALLHAAKVLSETREAKEFGIEFAKPIINLDKLRNWKNEVVEKLTGGLGQISKLRKVKYIQGRATFIDSNSLSIEKKDGSKETLTFEKAILATGSSPIKLPIAPNSRRVLDSTSALDIENVPSSLLLIGGGYIGLELGTVYAELGSQVSVVEMMPGIIYGADRDLATVLEKRLKVIFKDIMISTKITQMEETSTGIKVTFEDKDGKMSSQEYEKVLVAIGRKPNSAGLGLENTKVKISDRGFIEKNAQLLTSDPSIYAIGDVAGNPMLAHKASHEGRTAVEAIAGHKVAFEPNSIPAVVFTDPEIAWCGLTETEAAQAGRTVSVVKYPWAASGRALTLNRTDGFTKLIIDPKTERILGISIVGTGAGELIAEGVLAIEMGCVVEDLKMCIHPHPTLTETMMESAEIFFGQSTHVYRPKK